MEDRVIENTDALSQFSYVTTFRRSGGSASEEAMRLREKYRQYVEIKCQLDATEVFIADLIACSTCFGHHYARNMLSEQ